METSDIALKRLLQDDYNNLYKIFQFKGYRRYGNTLKVKHLGKWICECTIPEFVWNYSKNPFIAEKLIDFTKERLLDDVQMIKWFMNANKIHECDEDMIISDDYDTALKWLASNKEKYVYSFDCLDKNNTTLKLPTEISSVDGDLFNGVLFYEDDIPEIETLTIRFDFPPSHPNSGQNDTNIQHSYFYEFDSEYIKTHLYPIEDGFYFCQVFSHPIPILFLTEPRVKMYISTTYKEGTEESTDDFWPVFTICHPDYRKWLKSHSFVVPLNLFDKLLLSEKIVQTISKQKQD